MPTVRISETFDLSTKKGKMGLIGIHTPPRYLLEAQYGGLMNNYRKVRFLGCDVVLACAATLPLDPLQVANDNSHVNPADSMNPILYRPVSNAVFETLVAKIKGASNVLPSSFGSSVNRVEGSMPGDVFESSEFDVYYSILAHDSKWRKSMPQTGLVMRGLAPLMYPVYSDFGNEVLSTSGSLTQDPTIASDSNVSTYQAIGRVVKGRAIRSPALPLWQGIKQSSNIYETLPTPFPTTFVAGIIVPPAHTNGTVMYYRLRVTWKIRFEGCCPVQEHTAIPSMEFLGAATYWADYSQSKDLDHNSSVDSDGVDIEKVM